MSNSAKRISALPKTTILDANDRVVVLTNPDLTTNDVGGRGYTDVQTIRINDIALELASTLLPAASDSSFGVIKIGAGLAIDEDGIVTAPLPIASDTVTGVVKIGEGILFDEYENKEKQYTRITKQIFGKIHNIIDHYTDPVEEEEEGFAQEILLAETPNAPPIIYTNPEIPHEITTSY